MRWFFSHGCAVVAGGGQVGCLAVVAEGGRVWCLAVVAEGGRVGRLAVVAEGGRVGCLAVVAEGGRVWCLAVVAEGGQVGCLAVVAEGGRVGCLVVRVACARAWSRCRWRGSASVSFEPKKGLKDKVSRDTPIAVRQNHICLLVARYGAAAAPTACLVDRDLESSRTSRAQRCKLRPRQRYLDL